MQKSKNIISCPSVQDLVEVGVLENPLIIRGDNSELDEIITEGGIVCSPKFNHS